MCNSDKNKFNTVYFQKCEKSFSLVLRLYEKIISYTIHRLQSALRNNNVAYMMNICYWSIIVDAGQKMKII